MIFSTSLALLLSILPAEAIYLRTQKNSRDVYNPNITSPVAGSIWRVGTTAMVTWNTSDAPQRITNRQGMVVLGRTIPGSLSEHLNIEHPLAANFSLLDGNVSFPVPDVPSAKDYIIVLFGDSGNASPTFTIVEA